MASLKFILGMIPSTAKIEQNEKALIGEFEKLNTFSASDQLARYNYLTELVNSSAFRDKRKEIESLRYNGSEESAREKEFLSLQKSKDLTMYFRTAAGSMLKRFRDMDGSQKIKDFEALESYISSPQFREKEKMRPITFKDTDDFRKFVEYKALKADPEIKSYYKAAAKGEATKSRVVLRFEELRTYVKSAEFLARKRMKPVTFKDSEEYKKLLEYKRQKSSPDIKEYYRFKSSKEYSNFLNTDGSTRLSRYYELKEYIGTPEFKERKNYLLDKKRFEKTEMFREILEFNRLKKNPDIIWYFKVKDSDKFDILKKRELTFNDEFEGNTLDTVKWLTNYYWGEKLLKDRYSVESDLQAYTEKDNFEVRNSLLKIITKAQKTTGKVWSAARGFETKEFSYTSGIINTGTSFRQQYGTFSAKIRLGNPLVRNAFWMLSDKITPHIDICRTSKGKVLFDHIPFPGKFFKKSLGSKYANGFYIYSLEWTPDRLVWKINGEEVFRRTSDIPGEPMYILFSGGVENPINGFTTMDIDWIRVYRSL
jgi:hypothetical protein